MADATGGVTAGLVTIEGVGVNSFVGAPAPVVEGVAHSGRVAEGDVVSTAPEVESVGLTGNLAAGFVTVNPPTLLAGGHEGNPMSTPAPVIEAVGLTGQVGSGVVDAYAVAIEGVMLAGNIGTGDVQAPRLEISGGAGTHGQVSALRATIGGIGFSGSVGAGGVRAEKVSLSGSLLQNNTATGTVEARAPTISTSNISDLIGTGTLSTLRSTVTSTGHSGTVSTGSVTTTAPTMLAGWHQSTTSTGTVVAPAPTITSIGVVNSDASLTYTGVALNTNNKAVTEYLDTAYNSMCVFNGVFLAATATGVVELTGEDDQGVDIVASVRGATANFDSSKVKKVINAYTSIRASGELRFTLNTDNAAERKYRLVPRSSGLHAAKVSFGLGPQGVHWRWGLENQGYHFELNQIIVDMEETDRRIV